MKQKLLKLLYKLFGWYGRIYIHRMKPKVIGITGSVGKTSARMIIAQVLDQFLPAQRVYTSPKNYNSELGLVFSIFQVEDYTPGIFSLFKLVFILGFRALFSGKNYDIIVLEYGIDHPKDMEHLLQIVVPDIAIFTQLDYIHAENFSSKDAVGEEKMKLLDATKIKYLNYKDDFQLKYYDKLTGTKYFYNKKQINYSYELESNHVVAKFTSNSQYNITTNILGAENFAYIELALSIIKELGYTISAGDFDFKVKLQNGRFTIIHGVYESLLIDSSYNAGSKSMIKMIENTKELRDCVFPERKIIFVLGDMREIGDNSQKLHEELYEYASEIGDIISVGKETKRYFGPHLGNYIYAREAGIFLHEYLSLQKKGEYIILFKGSQNTIYLEEAIKQLLVKEEDKKYLVRQEDYWNKEAFNS